VLFGWIGGRAPLDPVMMFKILVIRAADNLSGERTEFLLGDRLPFMRFLALSLADRVAGARTIWLVRERLTKAGAGKTLFERFDATLREAGFIAMSGRIVDAGLIAAPAQHRRREEGDQGAFPMTGRTSPRNCAKRTAAPAGRRSSPRPSRARMARRRPAIWQFQSLVIKIIFRSVAASFAGRARQMLPRTRAVVYAKGFSTRPTQRAAFGRSEPKVPSSAA